MSDLGAILKSACDQVIHDPSLAPLKNAAGDVITTYCNQGALIVAHAMGCHEFDTPAGDEPMMADGMIQLMDDDASGNWTKVSGADATIHALGGGLCFAAMVGKKMNSLHGHITAIYPVGMQFSGSLNKDVPMVANVGTCQAEERTSQAFLVKFGEPNYYAWKNPEGVS